MKSMFSFSSAPENQNWPTGTHWVVTDKIGDKFAPKYKDVVPDPDDVIFLQFTSGSTGVRFVRLTVL